MNAQRQLLLLLTAAMIMSSIFVAGCLSSNNTNETNQSQLASSGANQETLKLMLAKIREVPPTTTGSVQSWTETWIDANTVKVSEVSGDVTNDTTMGFSNFTLQRFSTIDEATKFVKSHTNGYNLISTTSNDTEPYNRATGHKPTEYAHYIKSSQVRIDQPIIYHYVVQTDNIVMYGEEYES